ncbi:MAG: hypothetical protein ACERKD_24125 [Prolixibacteraceae bacterium]
MKKSKTALSVIGYTLALVLTIISTGAKAQTAKEADSAIKLYGILYYQPHGLEGSPYLNPEWKPATINLYNGQVAKNIQVKFNRINNDLIYYNEKFKNLFIVDRNTIDSFTIHSGQNIPMNFIKYSGNGLGYRLKNDDFVHLIYDGKIKFFAKYSAEITEANDLNSKDKVFAKNYYFLQNDQGLSEIKLKLRSIIKLYPEKKHELKKIAAHMHFRSHSTSDMMQLIQTFE